MLKIFADALLLVARQTAPHSDRRGRRSGLLSSLRIAMSHHRDRRHLAALDDHLLDDIGLTRAQVLEEPEQPFWLAAPQIRDARAERAWQRSWMTRAGMNR